MAVIEDAEAIIFDLRMCRGGAPDMVHFITSYLYGDEPFHLLTYHHARAEPDSAYTLSEVPGRRRPDVDAYVVTSRFTGSGGEEFTHNLKHHGRATVVGETTAGASLVRGTIRLLHPAIKKSNKAIRPTSSQRPSRSMGKGLSRAVVMETP